MELLDEFKEVTKVRAKFRGAKAVDEHGMEHKFGWEGEVRGGRCGRGCVGYILYFIVKLRWRVAV